MNSLSALHRARCVIRACSKNGERTNNRVENTFDQQNTFDEQTIKSGSFSAGDGLALPQEI
jgi:hypothetical protein